MSLYGVHWSIDGVQAAFVMRGTQNGRYRVVFERAHAELPQIEAIDWAHPQIQHLREAEELGLPEGYGFTVVGITYAHASRSYTVEVQVADQYLGDVTGYQAQLSELQAQVAAAQGQAAAAQAELAGHETALAAAYTEGVESIG